MKHLKKFLKIHENNTDNVDTPITKSTLSVCNIGKSEKILNFSEIQNRKDRFEERASILEFDAGYNREKAERLAYLEVYDKK